MICCPSNYVWHNPSIQTLQKTLFTPWIFRRATSDGVFANAFSLAATVKILALKKIEITFFNHNFGISPIFSVGCENAAMLFGREAPEMI